MRLMERDPELDRMTIAFDRAGRGRGCVVFLSGDAGMGKTRLVAEFLARIADRARILQGGCDDLLTPRTLGPFRDIVRFAVGPLGSVEPTDRDALVEALLDELSHARRPAVLCVEDIHWADQATVDVLCLLARRVARLPAMLILTYRVDHDPADPVLRVSAAVPAGDVLRIDLAALSDDAVTQLAHDAGRPATGLVRLVGGNPFFLGEILAAPADSLPRSVVQAVTARLAGLPTTTRAAVDVLSLIPTGAEHWLVAALLDDPGVLEPAERAGVVIHTATAVQFRHELARRAIASEVPVARSVVLHERILTALIRTWADPSRLVHHAVGARDAVATARYARLAAEAAAGADSHREAAAFAELALEQHVDRSVAQTAALHRTATNAWSALNEFGAAGRHADLAVALWDERESPAALAEALLTAARLATLRGRPRNSMTTAERAVRLLQPLGPSRALALAIASVGSQLTLRGQLTVSRDWLDRSLRMAAETGAEDVTCYALIYRGVGRSQLADAGGIADQQRALELATRLHHWDYLTVAAHNLAVTHLRACRVTDAIPLLDLAARVAGEHKLDAAWFRIDAQRALCDLLRGTWPEAENRLRALLSASADPGVNAVNPLAFLGRLLARRGDPEAAQLIDRAWRLAVRSDEAQKLAVAAGARAEWLWLTGDLDGLVEFSEVCLDLAVRTHHRLLRAEVLRLLRRAGRPVVPFAGCPAPYAAGISGHSDQAAARWHRAGNPYEEALELTESNDRDAVIRGLDQLDRLGAAAAAMIRRRQLRRRGLRGLPRGRLASTRTNPALLTRRQSQVLALLADGRTNAEIAVELVLSERTVDNHVSAVLRTLGVSSRREAAGAAQLLAARSSDRTEAPRIPAQRGPR